MMVMMACFAVFRLDERALVLLPGNLAVAMGLLIGAAAVARDRPFSLPVGLASAGLTASMGLWALLQGVQGSRYLRLPGYPLIWVIVGLYIAFRLVIIRQQKRIQKERPSQPSDRDAGR